jgi:hypothetical protein
MLMVPYVGSLRGVACRLEDRRPASRRSALARRLLPPTLPSPDDPQDRLIPPEIRQLVTMDLTILERTSSRIRMEVMAPVRVFDLSASPPHFILRSTGPMPPDGSHRNSSSLNDLPHRADHVPHVTLRHTRVDRETDDPSEGLERDRKISRAMSQGCAILRENVKWSRRHTGHDSLLQQEPREDVPIHGETIEL